MGLFDKLKNIFIEEELVDDTGAEKEVDIPAKKEEIEIKEIKNDAPVVKEVKEEVNEASDRSLVDTKENFKFPIIFEEDDFKEEKRRTKSINVLERENTKYEPEIRREAKPQKKVFKPSPVISPVYGVLDKNYSKEDITSKDGLLNDSEDKIDIDYVIKKAYGSDTTLKEENKEEDTKIDLFKEEEIKSEDVNVTELDEKIKSIDDLLKDTSDDDFYSLVDSMYKDSEVDE